MEPVTTKLEVEFHRLLLKLGRNLSDADTESLMFLFEIPPNPSSNKSESTSMSLYAFSSLEAMGHIDLFSPDKLREILSDINRIDLIEGISEYKQSGVYKTAMLMREKTTKKRGKDGKRGAALDERHVAAKLLTGAKMAANQEERRWGDMFAVALTHTAQVAEQTELLRQSLEAPEQTNWRTEEALRSILTAQDRVESLSKILKRAVEVLRLVKAEDSEKMPGKDARVFLCRYKWSTVSIRGA